MVKTSPHPLDDELNEKCLRYLKSGDKQLLVEMREICIAIGKPIILNRIRNNKNTMHIEAYNDAITDVLMNLVEQPTTDPRNFGCLFRDALYKKCVSLYRKQSIRSAITPSMTDINNSNTDWPVGFEAAKRRNNFAYPKYSMEHNNSSSALFPDSHHKIIEELIHALKYVDTIKLKVFSDRLHGMRHDDIAKNRGLPVTQVNNYLHNVREVIRVMGVEEINMQEIYKLPQASSSALADDILSAVDAYIGYRESKVPISR